MTDVVRCLMFRGTWGRAWGYTSMGTRLRMPDILPTGLMRFDEVSAVSAL